MNTRKQPPLADAPPPGFSSASYHSAGGVAIERRATPIDAAAEIETLVTALDHRRGVLFSSSYEYPGRYTRWDFGFTDPPLAVASQGRQIEVAALNSRGEVLLQAVDAALAGHPAVVERTCSTHQLRCRVREPRDRVPEELRSKQPSVFSLLRVILDLFRSPEDSHLGLYGAFGYDLALQFEPLRLRLERSATQRDLLLYLPDQIAVIDHRRETAARLDYEFTVGGRTTRGVARDGTELPYRAAGRAETRRAAGTASGSGSGAGAGSGDGPVRDHSAAEYAQGVQLAREAFRRGDLFEVVLSQTFSAPCETPPGELFRRLRRRNPSPYGFLINLGEGEYLVGASPEMYVRVEGRRVETCPIAGTVPRGADALEDAEQIRGLLNSVKEESELTMCTDVDRNDKSRICVPGSVRVLGRRQIELYSHLIHTVDHVEGTLREDYDALDAFLCHTWAVTVTGAPKTWAMQFIEDHERSSRAWYSGAVGRLGFDGNLNTGLTLRTIQIRAGMAQVRAGATLLYDSDPAAEEAETRVKAAVLLDVLARPGESGGGGDRAGTPADGCPRRRVLLVDHSDSFVHTLANYLRQIGTEVVTWRFDFPPGELEKLAPDLVVLSPGPGTPRDFGVADTVGRLVAAAVPVFGVCLGLQGIAEFFGGRLALLDPPVHGKPSTVTRLGETPLFRGLPERFQAARYHSLYAVASSLPPELAVTAESEDGIPMAVEHQQLPVAAVQFHPESILTPGQLGQQLLANALAALCAHPGPRTAAHPPRQPKEERDETQPAVGGPGPHGIDP